MCPLEYYQTRELLLLFTAYKKRARVFPFPVSAAGVRVSIISRAERPFIKPIPSVGEEPSNTISKWAERTPPTVAVEGFLGYFDVIHRHFTQCPSHPFHL